jgi:hypothetical protein
MTPADVIVLKGRPADEEIAALVAVLTALNARAVAATTETTRSGDMWSSGPGRPAFRPPGAWTPLRARRAA